MTKKSHRHVDPLAPLAPLSPKRVPFRSLSAPGEELRLVAEAHPRLSIVSSRALDRPVLYPALTPRSLEENDPSPPLVVAIVGARRAAKEALLFARAAAHAVAASGRVVISGGALGIDGAAHEGALDAGGLTWCVVATGPDKVFPEQHAELFARIEASAGAMVWTREEGTETLSAHFLSRNAVLVSLSDAVLVVQAGTSSGSLNTARKAQERGIPIYVARPPAWGEGFEGSRALIRERVGIPVDSMEELLARLGLTSVEVPAEVVTAQLELNLSSPQAHLLSRVTKSPQHMDEIAHSAGLSARETATLLLTLSLENVVVEGPPGFFRRQQLL